VVKFGINLLLWTDKFDSESVGLIPMVADMGFDAVEIPIFDTETVDVEATGKALEENGLDMLGCVIMAPGRDTISGDPAERESALGYLRRCVEITSDLGGDLLCGPMYSVVGKLVGRGRTEEEWKLAVEGIREIAEYASPRGVILAIEPLNRFETYFINTASDVIRFVREVNHPNARILLDTFHMNIEEKSLPKAIREAGELLAHLHCSENDRGVPGTGHIDWEGVFGALVEIGYDRYIVLESFVPGIEEIAKAAAIWRDINPSDEAFAREGLSFLKEMAEKAMR
jgi:D-psicose/D-tagatose/L-ribulose 3-epimerase